MINNNLIYESDKKSNTLLEQYSSVYSSGGYDFSMVEELSNIPGLRSMDNLIFNHDDIMKAIDELSVGSSPGPDGIPTILLRKCASSLAVPLFEMWSKSLESGKIPINLKFGQLKSYPYSNGMINGPQKTIDL